MKGWKPLKTKCAGARRERNFTKDKGSRSGDVAALGPGGEAELHRQETFAKKKKQFGERSATK